MECPIATSNKFIQHGNVVVPKLGVGRLTPMFIQEPFWELTAKLPDAHDVMVNRDYQFLPQAIENKGQAIKADLAKVLDDVLAELNR